MPIKQKVNKSILKSGYYYEFKEFYDTLPEKLPITEKVFERTLEKITKEVEILTLGVPFNKEEAFGLACKVSKTLKNNKYKIIFFKDKEITCGLFVCRGGDGRLWVGVFYVSPDFEWGAGGGVLFSKKSLTLKSSPSETLTLKNLVEDLETIINKYKSHL
jgi:hypothetical protein